MRIGLFGQPCAKALPERGKVRRVAMGLERRLVDVRFVEEEELRIGRRTVGAIDEAPWLRAQHDGGLLRQECGERIPLAVRCPQLCDDG